MTRSIPILVLSAMLGASWMCTAQVQAPPGTSDAAQTAPGAGRGGPGGPGGAPGRGAGRGPGAAAIPPGPPAPVPPQVAMARPTTQELTQINAELKKFVDTADASAKPLLQKYQSLLVVKPLRDNPTIRPTPGVRFGRHEAFVEEASKGGIDLLLHGDSITDLWRNSRESYTKFFGQYKTANFGVSGDTTQGVLWGLQNGEGKGFQPKAIMLMIGTNSSGNSTGPEIAEGVGAVVLEMRKDFPDAKILLLAIFPRNGVDSPARKVNAEASEIFSRLADDKHVFFMDIGKVFLAPDGSIPREIMGDSLHPTAAGYELWGNAVKDKLAELMK